MAASLRWLAVWAAGSDDSVADCYVRFDVGVCAVRCVSQSTADVSAMGTGVPLTEH